MTLSGVVVIYKATDKVGGSLLMLLENSLIVVRRSAHERRIQLSAEPAIVPRRFRLKSVTYGKYFTISFQMPSNSHRKEDR
jgi:hypothetical protein